MWAPARPIELDDDKLAALKKKLRSRKTPRRIATRIRIVLMAGDGDSNCDIADALDVNRKTVLLWRARFTAAGIDGLLDAPRKGRRPFVTAGTVERIVRTTLDVLPEGASRWTTRSLGAWLGLSKMTILRVWRANGIGTRRRRKRRRRRRR